MKLAFLSPLPPLKSGVAYYSAGILSHLVKKVDVTAVVDQESVQGVDVPVMQIGEFREKRESFDSVICQLGNNLLHEFAYRYAMEHPSLIVLHDSVLHHLVTEMTLARGDDEGYVEIMRANHGAMGEALARSRIAGFHGELGNFLFPASADVARRSKAVIVHNHYAAGLLREQGVETPIEVLPLPTFGSFRRGTASRSETRKRLGFSDQHRLIGMFGFVTEAKRPEVVLGAFAKAAQVDPDLRFLIVGQASHTIDLEALGRAAGADPARWRATGFVTEEEFDDALGAVDAVVNLRYPSAGESSGPLIQLFEKGIPVAVSDYAQFAELPPDVVTKISFDDEVGALREFMLRQIGDAELRRIRERQREWVRANASSEAVVKGYLRVIRDGAAAKVARSPRGVPMPLLPQLDAALEQQIEARRFRIRLTNRGDVTIRTRSFGVPSYRLIAKGFDAMSEIDTRWTALPGDLAAGESAHVDVVMSAPVSRLMLLHAVDGIPAAADEPFAIFEVAG